MKSISSLKAQVWYTKTHLLLLLLFMCQRIPEHLKYFSDQSVCNFTLLRYLISGEFYNQLARKRLHFEIVISLGREIKLYRLAFATWGQGKVKTCRAGSEASGHKFHLYGCCRKAGDFFCCRSLDGIMHYPRWGDIWFGPKLPPRLYPSRDHDMFMPWIWLPCVSCVQYS